jgi:hypothetical protein
MFLLPLILGIGIGFGLAYAAVGFLAVKSNDMGNTKGDFEDFAENTIHIKVAENNVSGGNFYGL